MADSVIFAVGKETLKYHECGADNEKSGINKCFLNDFDAF